MNKLLYYIMYSWMYLHALLPFSVLYILSDILYFLVYKVAGYRLKVVRHNLALSFPNKTDKERKTIEREFYHHFCDYFVETLKLLHVSDEEMKKRMQFENVEQIKDLMKDGNSVLMFLGHYCNWEWIPSITMDFRDKGDENKILGQIYKPLSNKAVDDLFLKIRSRFGSLGIPKNDTLRMIVKLRREKKQVLIGFMADQTPSVPNIHYWTNFLNQDSAVFTGVERIAKQTGYAVIYLDMEKIKRGYYKATVRLVTDNPLAEPENRITDTYIQAMEKTILRNPAYWLWTHKRWKRTREEVEQIQQHRK
ncbi:KDO2-lipid IV(A) lauroyltransferase [Dysgonomonas sp. PFB1-18]|uniref:lysophospholipid acyltransferase family protein n=1 Tax=unclassified Dysgonomonas TaxID=2630389 RepID=UPI0024744BA1|nr:MULTISPECIES: lysophospholipid acyltransferase family protein [unclassified Dysgonomonas]MDH6309761.1 KDO2-lipid IV(A) lauroyltransferase [Dysgonomonas sp. PF1-14]MDH6339231.1 KDO2-lipid IV(A) lauroyltransferase [Dysgonomonas sp. PF1-16]MDH6380730.1 KDO2-lipid IV(A) lauroyltransferase [Dysgonomonas sp. PFB1-18]MDH6398226.1 KDO2-lipid IV(A) lauroyltransferase [Dysgonomonas sp. PF1-23]